MNTFEKIKNDIIDFSKSISDFEKFFNWESETITSFNRIIESFWPQLNEYSKNARQQYRFFQVIIFKTFLPEGLIVVMYLAGLLACVLLLNLPVRRGEQWYKKCNNKLDSLQLRVQLRILEVFGVSLLNTENYLLNTFFHLIPF